jgi:glycyl-tRNA synthetase beta chain
MRWGDSKTEFVRPVHWAVLLADDQVINASILGKSTGQQSYGHRFHHPAPVNIANAMDYQSALKTAKVMVSYEERCDSILAQIQQLSLADNAKVLVDEALLNEVSALVEWPVVMSGRFEASFLDVPAEALISSMQEHQKYFPVAHESTGKLMPYFVFVSNLVSKQPNAIIEGNERVIRPRLADAAFFWNTDRKIPLADRVAQLDKVLFQKRLGTLLEKTERIESLALELARSLPIKSNLEHIQRAARLAKADLVSEMVFEFGDMQGIAGRYYAEHDGEASDVALAIQEHYQPKHAGDALPSGMTGQMVALADRLDTLVGIFGIGQLPTGTKDPYALRRASVGVLRILVETELDLDLKTALEASVAEYSKQGKALTQPNLIETLLNYLLDRFSAWYQDQNIPIEVFQAVRAINISSPFDINLRVKAVHRFYQQEAALALASAAKRVGNLLNKTEGQMLTQVDPEQFKEAAE